MSVKAILRSKSFWLAFFLISLFVAWEAYPFFSLKEMFRRSKADLERYAAQVNISGGRALATPPKRLGYFKVLKTESLPHGFLFQSDYGSPFDWLGIAYSTERLQGDDLHVVYEKIEGNWYTVFRQ